MLRYKRRPVCITVRFRQADPDRLDPRSNVIRLAECGTSFTSVASIGVAAHEAGQGMRCSTPSAMRRSAARDHPGDAFGFDGGDGWDPFTGLLTRAMLVTIAPGCGVRSVHAVPAGDSCRWSWTHPAALCRPFSRTAC